MPRRESAGIPGGKPSFLGLRHKDPLRNDCGTLKHVRSATLGWVEDVEASWAEGKPASHCCFMWVFSTNQTP